LDLRDDNQGGALRKKGRGLTAGKNTRSRVSFLKIRLLDHPIPSAKKDKSAFKKSLSAILGKPSRAP
jgi:hypothetical protein